MSARRDGVSLRSALGAVERRLAVRARVRAAALTAAALALPAWALVPGALGAAAIALGAAAGAVMARPPGGRAAAWLDRHGADDDLMISGAAADDGRVVTALSDGVIVAASERMTSARRPSPWPGLAGAAAIAGCVLAVGLARGPAHDEADAVAERAAGSRILSAAPGGDEPAGADRPDGDHARARARAVAGGAVIVGGPRPERGGGAAAAAGPGVAGDGDAAAAGAGLPGGLTGPADDRTGGGTGAGAGDRGAVRAPGADAATIAAGAASGVLATTAPRAGARADVIGVPARYRELVAAYLAAAPERAP